MLQGAKPSPDGSQIVNDIVRSIKTGSLIALPVIHGWSILLRLPISSEPSLSKAQYINHPESVITYSHCVVIEKGKFIEYALAVFRNTIREKPLIRHVLTKNHAIITG